MQEIVILVLFVDLMDPARIQHQSAASVLEQV